jgi:hypothetical protein
MHTSRKYSREFDDARSEVSPNEKLKAYVNSFSGVLYRRAVKECLRHYDLSRHEFALSKEGWRHDSRYGKR